MYGAIRCDLCGAEVALGETTRVAEMELCAPCDAGDFGGRLADRGLRFQWLSEDWYPTGGEVVGGGSRKIRGAIPYDLGFRALFSKEDWLSKVEKLFGKELQTGDKEFDDAIYVRTKDREALAEALQNEGLRAALQNLVESMQATVVIEEGTVSFEVYTMPADGMGGALRSIALVLHHLERWAVSLPLPHRRSLATYPDLREKAEYVRNAQGLLGGDNRYLPKAFLFERSTLDHLGPVAEIHDLMAGTSKTLEVLQLKDVSFVSGDLAHLSGLSTLRVLEIDKVPAARTLPPLAALQRLEELTIDSSPVTDIEPLSGLSSLRELKLLRLPLSDIRPLAMLGSLRKLDLRGTQVEDLRPLAALPALESLWVQGLAVSDEQVRALRQARPQLELDPY